MDKDNRKIETNSNEYAIEMMHITKEFPGIVANDDITFQVRKGEIHALLGENGAGKSTLMSVLFGLYQPEKGEIRIGGKAVHINNPNDATNLHIGMVHQHFKIVENFTVLENIILGVEPLRELRWEKDDVSKSKAKVFFKKIGRFFSKTLTWGNKHITMFLDKAAASKKIMDLSKKYGLNVDINAKIENITVGMQQRTEILKMLYRDNDILIFDEPTAVLTPQEIEELMQILRNLKAEGKSIIFISHKLNETKEVADRVTVLRKGKYVGTRDVKDITKEEMCEMMVGRKVELEVIKTEARPTNEVLRVENLVCADKIHHRNVVNDVTFNVRKGEIVCIAGIDGNGQTELIHGITGLIPLREGKLFLNGEDISKKNIRQKNLLGISHIPEDRHKHGLVLDYSLEQNLVLQKYFLPEFSKAGFIRFKNVRSYAANLIEQFDIRSGQGPITKTRSMSGGNQQKAIVAREIDRNADLLIAVQPTRGLDVGAIEYIHSQIVAQRDNGRAILLVSLELDEVMSLSDRILVMYEGKLVGEFKCGKTTAQELGLYMSGAKTAQINAVKSEGE